MGRKLKWVLAGSSWWCWQSSGQAISCSPLRTCRSPWTTRARAANAWCSTTVRPISSCAGRRPASAIILLGGSEGGLQEGINARARLLQAEGYSVLYPGYYRTSEATKTFDMVPLETFDAALRYLQAREDIDTDRIGLVGGSKGAEGALLFASMRPEIVAWSLPCPAASSGRASTGAPRTSLSSARPGASRGRRWHICPMTCRSGGNGSPA